MFWNRKGALIGCFLIILLLTPYYKPYHFLCWGNPNLVYPVHDAIIVQLDDRVNDVPPEYGFIDIIEVRVLQFNIRSLQFEMKLNKPVPLRPNHDVIYLWMIDTDRNITTGQKHYHVGSEFNIRLAFYGGHWHGYIDDTIRRKTFRIPVIIDNDVISASVDLNFIGYPSAFNFEVSANYRGIIDKSDKYATARLSPNISRVGKVSEVLLRPTQILLKDGNAKAWISVILKDDKGNKIDKFNSIKFFLENTDIAEVKEYGLIIAKPEKVGSSWLTAKVDGIVSSNIVTINVGEVNIMPPILLLSTIDNPTGKLTCEAKDAYGKRITPKNLAFYNSNLKVVNVSSDGTVTALSPPREFGETPYISCSVDGIFSTNYAVVRVTETNLGITMEEFKGKYVTFYVPREFIQGFDYRKIFREYDVLRITDIAYYIMSSIFDYYPFNGGTQFLVNDPGFRSDKTVPCGLSGNPIRLGTEVDKPEHNSCMIVAWGSGFPQWFVYFHEMGHNFFLSGGPKVWQFLPGLSTDWVYSEALATALGMYVAMKLKEYSYRYSIPEKILTNILQSVWHFGSTPDLDLYLKKGARYDEITPNILDEMIDVICQRYGYESLYRFFSLFADRDKPFSFTIQSKSEQATLFVAALSAAVKDDLREQFKQWGFPVDDKFYEQIIDEVTNSISQKQLIDKIPKTIHNYDGTWRNKDFNIILVASDNKGEISEIFYRINNGPVLKVSSDGLPLISEEGATNILEFWSVDKFGNEERPKNYLTEIKLDKTAPIIEFVKREPSDDINFNQTVKIFAKISDNLSGVKDVILSYQIIPGFEWNNISMKFNKLLELYECEIEGVQKIATIRYKIIAYDEAGNVVVDDSPSYIYSIKPRIKELRIEAPKIALIGSSAEAKIILVTTPPYQLPVNISVIGCDEHHTDLVVKANETLILKSDNVCTMIITARLLEYTNQTLIRWEKLILNVNNSLGRFKGGFIVPVGELKLVVFFSNGSPAPAKISIEGDTAPTLQKAGSHVLKVKAELWGACNETTLIVYAVPLDLYLQTKKILEELNFPSNLNRTMEKAILSGDWDTVIFFTKVYSSASRSFYDPLAYIAFRCAREWAREGNKLYLDIAYFLTTFRFEIYMTAAIVIGAFIIRKIFKVKASRKVRE